MNDLGNPHERVLVSLHPRSHGTVGQKTRFGPRNDANAYRKECGLFTTGANPCSERSCSGTPRVSPDRTICRAGLTNANVYITNPNDDTSATSLSNAHDASRFELPPGGVHAGRYPQFQRLPPNLHP